MDDKKNRQPSRKVTEEQQQAQTQPNASHEEAEQDRLQLQYPELASGYMPVHAQYF